MIHASFIFAFPRLYIRKKEENTPSKSNNPIRCGCFMWISDVGFQKPIIKFHIRFPPNAACHMQDAANWPPKWNCTCQSEQLQQVCQPGILFSFHIVHFYVKSLVKLKAPDVCLDYVFINLVKNPAFKKLGAIFMVSSECQMS